MCARAHSREGGVTAQHILSLVSPAVLVAWPLAMHGCALKNSVIVDGSTPMPDGLPNREPVNGTWQGGRRELPFHEHSVGFVDCIWFFSVLLSLYSGLLMTF